MLSADYLSQIGIEPLPDDPIKTIRGVGGTEVVYCRKIQNLIIGNIILSDFLVEIGAMDYGFEIKGILGMDFLLQTKCIIDLQILHLFSAN